MATKNHKRSMSQPERAFWREAFLRIVPTPATGNGFDDLPEVVAYCANFADAAIEEYRKRVTWRQP